MATDRWTARVAALVGLLPRPVRWVLTNEAALVCTWWMVLRRTRDVPRGARPVPYAAEQAPVFGVIAVVTLVEVVPVHFLVPWPWLRVLLLVLGVYGLLWAIGYHQGWRRRPHLVTDDRLVVRCGPGPTVEVPLDAVVRTGREQRTWDRRGVRVVDGRTVTVTHSGDTTVWLETGPDCVLDVAGTVVRGATVHLTADDPAALVATLDKRGARAAPPPTAGPPT